MTYDLESKIEQIKAGLEVAEQKLGEFEEMGRQAEGKLSSSFVAHLEELRLQKKLLAEHLATLEKEKIQSWQESNFGNDVVDVAQSMLDRVNKLLNKLSTHKN